jgi:hypothetical protein
MNRSGFVMWSTSLFASLFLWSACGADTQSLRSARIAFETSRSQILVPVQFGDGKETYWFILDSAVDPSVIDDSLLELDHIELVSLETHEAEGAGDDEGLQVRLARVHRFSVGGMDLSGLEAVAADLSGFSKTLDRPLAGILGYSFFIDKVVRIDYANAHVDVALSRPELSDPTNSLSVSHSVPLTFMTKNDLIPVFDIVVNDETVRVSLDTGSSLGIQFYSSAVERLGLESLREQAESSSIIGARGQTEIRNATLDDVVLGPFEEFGVPVSFSERQHNAAERQGNVGNRFLSRFVLTLDYVDDLIIFER